MDRKQQELYDAMKKYVENNCIDISSFRKENPNEYALLPHYFGSVQNAVETFGWIRITRAPHKRGTGITLRNQLAFDMLKELRKQGTLEEIANRYGVTRPAINQLYKALKSSMEAHEEETNTDSKN